MKKILILMMVLLPMVVVGQDRDFGWWINRYKYTVPMAATAGFLDASAEVMSYNYTLFDKTWGIKNDDYWNPDLSYKNKWKNGDYRQGERFFLSSSALSWTVEGRKLVRMGQRLVKAGQIAIPLCAQERQPWWVYGVDFLVNFGVEAVAFEITNEVYRSHLY